MHARILIDEHPLALQAPRRPERAGRLAARHLPSLLVILMGLACIAAIKATPAAAACPDVTLIGARGSGEPAEVKQDGKTVAFHHGLGVPVDYMAQRLKKAVLAYGETFSALPVVYNADSVNELVPSRKDLIAMAAFGAVPVYYERHLKPYIASINEGVSQTVKEVDLMLSGCPETELVLAGYSQGAMAIHQAELKMEQDGDDEALDAIGGTLLLGDGDRVPNSQAKLVGGAPAGGEGVRVYLHGVKRRDVAEPETTVEICAQNDIVCDFSLHIGLHSLSWYKQAANIHSSYDTKPQRHYLDAAVDWLASEMGLTD